MLNFCTTRGRKKAFTQFSEEKKNVDEKSQKKLEEKKM